MEAWVQRSLENQLLNSEPIGNRLFAVTQLLNGYITLKKQINYSSWIFFSLFRIMYIYDKLMDVF